VWLLSLPYSCPPNLNWRTGVSRHASCCFDFFPTMMNPGVYCLLQRSGRQNFHVAKVPQTLAWAGNPKNQLGTTKWDKARVTSASWAGIIF
jgi:hypothetical protein